MKRVAAVVLCGLLACQVASAMAPSASPTANVPLPSLDMYKLDNKIDPSPDAYAEPGPWVSDYPIQSTSYAAPAAVSHPKFPAMTCNGYSYCFKKPVAPVSAQPLCPTGFSYDAKTTHCYRYDAYSCPPKTTGSKDNTTCAICPPLSNYMNGTCMVDCPKGYKETISKGVAYCTQECENGFYPYGSKCLAYTKYYYPKSCSSKSCGLPGFTFMPNVSAYSILSDKLMYDSSATSQALKAADDASMSSYTDAYATSYYTSPNFAKDASCKCVETKGRAVFKKENLAPKVVPGKLGFAWCDSQCPQGGSPDKKTGLCTKNCPPNSKVDTNGDCLCPCPAGYKECVYFGKTMCVTKYDLFGCDSCDIMSTLFNYLDQNVSCPATNPQIVPPAVVKVPVASPKPTLKPTPKPTPKPSPTTVTVVKADGTGAASASTSTSSSTKNSKASGSASTGTSTTKSSPKPATKASSSPLIKSATKTGSTKVSTSPLIKSATKTGSTKASSSPLIKSATKTG